MPKSMVGTQRGSEVCTECRHGRIRHGGGGLGPCAKSWTITTTTADHGPVVSLVRCGCPGFANKKG